MAMNLFSFLLFSIWPKRAQIEITNRCNLSCRMCPRRSLNLIDADMEIDAFFKIIDKLSPIKEITLSGWGEPLLHPQLDKMIEYCRKKGKKIKLTTNGLVLDRKGIESLLKIDEVAFSVDEVSSKGEAPLGHRHNAVFTNIKALRGLRKGHKPFIRIQSIYYRDNKADIFEIMRIAKEVGVDSVRIMRVNPLYCGESDTDLYTISQKELLSFYKEVEQRAKRLRVKVELVNYSFFSGVKKIMYKIFLKFLPGLTGIRCVRALNFIYITVQGNVLPTGCGELYEYVVGDLLKENLDTIWHSTKFRHFRENHMHFCNEKCGFLSVE